MKILVLVFGLVGFLFVQESDATSCKKCMTDCCYTKFKPLGCFVDKENPRRDLPNLLFSKRKNGGSVDYSKFPLFMYDCICQCAHAAQNAGFKFFAIQNIGECWAGNGFGIHGDASVDKCIDENWNQICTFRVGKAYTNFVYELVDSCEVQSKFMGCFKDKRSNRAIGTGSDPEITIRGKINWACFDTVVHKLGCECAKAAKATYGIGAVFGLQYFGECWIGPSNTNYSNYGTAKPNKCVSACGGKCDGSPYPYDWCMGKQWVNAVYKVQ